MCSFHNKLKNNPSYLGGKFNRRVYYLLQTLMKIEEDMFLTRQQKMLGLRSNRKAMKEGDRHKSGLQLPLTTISVRWQPS